MRPRRVLIALVLFGVSFGYVEAAIVVYLRALYEPLRQRIEPDRPVGELFPLIRLDQLQAEGPLHIRRLATELGREAATLIMLATIALAMSRNGREWFAGFMITFGVWDIFYYVFLKVLLDWPRSLLTWDILFLLPVPWVGPVISPVIVAVSMIAGGVILLWRESLGRPVGLNLLHWTLIVSGALMIILAFCWDYRNTASGGDPNPFNWGLFAAGEVVGFSSFLHALSWGRQGPRQSALFRRTPAGSSSRLTSSEKVT